MRTETLFDRIRREQLLIESTRETYDNMMSAVIELWESVGETEDAKETSELKEFFRKTLKKFDRVTWALKWLRLAKVNEFIQQFEYIQSVRELPEEEKQALLERAKSLFDRYRKGIEKDLGKPLSDSELSGNLEYVASRSFKEDLQHFMSYTNQANHRRYISKIDEFDFSGFAPRDAKIELQKIEDEWSSTFKNRAIPHPDDAYHPGEAEELISFPDGFSWWLIDREYCDFEAKSMGHCGNAGNPRPGDRILSLRQEIETDDGEVKHVPHLTFILDANGYLGEMKGRKNQKPTEKYHKYIVPLLLHDAVKGIKGGGYAPENNFSLSDLDSHTRDEIVQRKPSLLPIYDRIKEEGLTKELENELYKFLEENNLPEIHHIDRERKVVELDSWDYSDFEHYFYMDEFEKAREFVETYMEQSGMDFDDALKLVEKTKFRDTDYIEFFNRLDDPYLQRIADDLGIEGNIRDYKTKERMALYFENSKYYPVFIKSVAKALSVTRNQLAKEFDKDIVLKYLNILADAIAGSVEVPFMDDVECYMNFVDFNEGYGGCETTLSDFLDALGYAFEYDEYPISIWTNRRVWWVFDPYRADDRLNEIFEYENLDPYVKDPEEQEKILKLHDIIQSDDHPIKSINPEDIDYSLAAHYFSKHIDFYEQEESCDEDHARLMEIRRLAGLRDH